MKVLVLGSTGMLGKALMEEFKMKNISAIGVARTNADINIDVLANTEEIIELIKNEKYTNVINTIAYINLDFCEKNPLDAYLLNTDFVASVVQACDEMNTHFIQISTDHFYTNDQDQLHAETDPIVLLNEYAKTKFLAEAIALTHQNSLVIRTNIVGFRNSGPHTFVEWIFSSFEQNQEITGYKNVYTSSIDVKSLARIISETMNEKKVGLFNISAKDAMTKYDFIKILAERVNKSSLVLEGELINTNLVRGDSLGLSVEKFEKAFPNSKLPSSLDVVNSITEEYLKTEWGELS